MSILSGDRYLDHLVRFVDSHAAQLLDGTLTLKLNPVGLHYVHSRLESLKEIETLLAVAPVDYLRSYVADLGDHRALEQLRRILGLLTSLKVVSGIGNDRRDHAPISLMPFSRLRVLELRGCDLSSAEPKGLLELRKTLERLVCHNSTDSLRHVFASRIVDIKDSPKWKKLSFVSCACNSLALMDDSLQLLPSVETLDLSRNRFTKVDNLKKCVKLRHLDLGFNQLRSVTMLTEVSSSRIVKLSLRNNALSSLRGLEYMKSLVGLDLSSNIISSFSELEVLGRLSLLESLWLEGNPIFYARWYRAHVFSYISDPSKLKLDEKNITAREAWERHVIFANRHKKPAGYGFYFPAKDDAQDESSQSTPKKRNLRVACIEEHTSDEEITELEPLLANDIDMNLRKDGNTTGHDCESTVTVLINKAEYMKKERSVHWLREFKEWMDQTEDSSSSAPNGDNLTITNERKLIIGSSSKGDQSSDSDLLVKDELRKQFNGGRSAIDRSLESRYLTNSPDPPQFKEDILLNRLFYDEIQLSTGWSDSGSTSSDEDTSCELYASSSDDEVVQNGQPSHTVVCMNAIPCEGDDTCNDIYEVFPVKRKARSRLVHLSESQNGDIENPYENNGKGVMSASCECSSSVGEEDDDLWERELYESVKLFFQTKVADSESAEICQDVIFCECILQRGLLRKLGLLRSSKNKLYLIVMEEDTPTSGETHPEVLESYKLEDVKLVVVGLGLQALRMFMMDDTTYLLLTRTIEKAQDLFSLLQICNSPSFDSGILLQSWEQVQVKLLEKELCSNLKMDMQLYSSLLIWKDNTEGGSWESRSIFVMEGRILLCIEDFVCFGSFLSDMASSPPPPLPPSSSMQSSASRYFSIDSCCSIRNILELVMDLHHNKCITLIVENNPDDEVLISKNQIAENRGSNEFVNIQKWRLQWFSQDTLLKFVSLLKAVHRETEAMPLPVHCTS